jgi:hypothetical protein
MKSDELKKDGFYDISKMGKYLEKAIAETLKNFKFGNLNSSSLVIKSFPKRDEQDEENQI